MGFLLAFSRKMYLTQYSHSIERRLNAKTAEKLRYTDTIAEYTSQINDIGDPDSPAVKKLEARKAEIEKYERKIDIEIQKLQTQLQAANTEIQSLDQAVQKGVQDSFALKLA